MKSSSFFDEVKCGEFAVHDLLATVKTWNILRAVLVVKLFIRLSKSLHANLSYSVDAESFYDFRSLKSFSYLAVYKTMKQNIFPFKTNKAKAQLSSCQLIVFAPKATHQHHHAKSSPVNPPQCVCGKCIKTFYVRRANWNRTDVSVSEHGNAYNFRRLVRSHGRDIRDGC